jgi:hypothetical protein
MSQAGPFVSTGHLPTPELLGSLVDEAHERFRTNAEGANSEAYPALAGVPRDLFGCASPVPTARPTASETQSASSQS